MTLPPGERQRVADILYGSLDTEDPAQVGEAWDAEIKSRLDQIDRGEVKLVPWEEVQAKINERLKR